MSFVPDFTDEARAQWRGLDFTRQELALDELERAVADPSVAVGRREFVRDFVHVAGGVRHYVFLRVLLNRSTGVARVIDVGHHAEPVADPDKDG